MQNSSGFRWTSFAEFFGVMVPRMSDSPRNINPVSTLKVAVESHRIFLVSGSETPNVGVQWVALCFLFWLSLVHISARRPVIISFSWLSSVPARKFRNISSNWPYFSISFLMCYSLITLELWADESVVKYTLFTWKQVNVWRRGSSG